MVRAIDIKIMEQILIIDFLNAFFNLFKARIEGYKIIDNKIFGIVGWINEEDKQAFVLKTDFEDSYIFNVKLLCDFLFENNFIDGDKIVLSENDLILRLVKNGWDENEAKEAISFICSFDVKMVDDGEVTDSFYIHF